MNNKWLVGIFIFFYAVMGLTVVYIFWNLQKDIYGVITGVIIAFVIPILSHFLMKIIYKKKKGVKK